MFQTSRMTRIQKFQAFPRGRPSVPFPSVISSPSGCSCSDATAARHRAKPRQAETLKNRKDNRRRLPRGCLHRQLPHPDSIVWAGRATGVAGTRGPSRPSQPLPSDLRSGRRSPGSHRVRERHLSAPGRRADRRREARVGVTTRRETDDDSFTAGNPGIVTGEGVDYTPGRGRMANRRRITPTVSVGFLDFFPACDAVAAVLP
jgi:hypothetical protein